MGVEKSSAYKKELASQRIVWQLRILHTPKRKKSCAYRDREVAVKQKPIV
jgi:hypothetical protein